MSATTSQLRCRDVFSLLWEQGYVCKQHHKISKSDRYYTAAHSSLELCKSHNIALYFLFFAVLTVSSFGCGVKEQEKLKIMQVITKVVPNFEKTAKEQILADERMKGVASGKFEWRFGTTREKENGVYVAEYGYWGRPPLRKILIGGAVEIGTAIITLGFFSYNPYPPDAETGLYFSLIVDINNEKVQLINNKQ